MVVSNSGVALHSRRIGGQPDTLLVAGGSRGLKTVTARAEHTLSVCNGAFILADQVSAVGAGDRGEQVGGLGRVISTAGKG